jgi:hypothetical protein
MRYPPLSLLVSLLIAEDAEEAKVESAPSKGEPVPLPPQTARTYDASAMTPTQREAASQREKIKVSFSFVEGSDG